jgi:hypothetical protein
MTIRRFTRSVLLYAEVHVVTALALWLLLRLAMRVVALSMGRPPVLTSATIAILLVALIFGIPLSLLLFALRRAIRGTPLRRGLWFGAIAVVVGGIAVFPEAVTVGHAWLNVPMFSGVLVVYGILFSLTADRLERHAERRRMSRVSPPPDLQEAPSPVQAAPAPTAR